MSGFESIKKAAEFNRVYKRGRYAHAPSFVIYYLKGDIKKFGFVASKKVGKAVQRNFAKRRLRALATQYLIDSENGAYVLVAKQPLLESSYSDLEQALQTALQRLKGKGKV